MILNNVGCFVFFCSDAPEADSQRSANCGRGLYFLLQRNLPPNCFMLPWDHAWKLFQSLLLQLFFEATKGVTA